MEGKASNSMSIDEIKARLRPELEIWEKRFRPCGFPREDILTDLAPIVAKMIAEVRSHSPVDCARLESV